MPLLVDKRGAVAVITISRPEARNAWGSDFTAEMKTVLADLEGDRAIRVAVLTGDPEGEAFSAGANLTKAETHAVASPGAAIEGMTIWRDFVANQLTDFAKPVIAAVNGYAIGVGFIATLACDLIVASERAEWRMPQVKLGIMPAYGGAVRLARWVGKGNAMRASLGYPITADEAFRSGLAQWLVPHEQLLDRAMEVAGDLAAMPPLALRLTKESLNRGMDIPNLRDASEADLWRFMALAQTEDSAEAHAAWREKRAPDFKGR